MIKETSNFHWNLANLPSTNNPFNKRIVKMNKFGRLPFPYSFLANILNEIIKERYINIKKVKFNNDFYCLFGNLHGDSVWFTNTYILDYAPVYFGKNITVGPDVKIITSWHDPENFNKVRAAAIHIEDNVWITMNVIVLPGVRIGQNSIIAAGSVVTKDVPQNTIVAGNPAKVIRNIDRSYPYWLDLQDDISKRKKNSRKNIITRIFRLPIKVLKKLLIYFLKKIL
jgi:maltose O-acetyltransferase